MKIGYINVDDNSVKQFIGEQAILIDILKAQLRKAKEELKEKEKVNGRLDDASNK